MQRRLSSDWEKRMTEFNAELQEEILDWIVPYVHMLSLAYYSNYQLMPRALLEDELNKRFEKKTVEKTFWYKELENIEEKLEHEDQEYAKLRKELRKAEERQYKGD